MALYRRLVPRLETGFPERVRLTLLAFSQLHASCRRWRLWLGEAETGPGLERNVEDTKITSKPMD